ncbi:MAG TPA: hypothetical protein VMR49_01440 [Candidatus Paceibacterota bacterium]|jgi:adenylate kinase family enzyme|nr:hypothetical protein [Candidatus Paceibacterota bacterium]
MKKEILNKILIVGDAGRGKSTLASKLSQKLGIQNYSTDDFYYEVKFSKIRNRQESIDQINQIYPEEKWIVEGTTEYLLEAGLDSADIIIHLKYKKILTQWMFLVKRYFQRDNDTISGVLHLMRHVLYKKYDLGYRKGKRTPSILIESHKHKVITLSSFKEIDEFINSL